MSVCLFAFSLYGILENTNRTVCCLFQGKVLLMVVTVNACSLHLLLGDSVSCNEMSTICTPLFGQSDLKQRNYRHTTNAS